MSRLPGRVAVAVTLLLGAASGCAQETGADRGQTLTVLAASSLTGVFEQLAGDFEEANAGVSVKLSFGSSATLAQQVVEGAPGDVLATADLTTMQTAQDAAGVDPPSTFATNRMVLVTPADEPAGVRTLQDLSDSGVVFLTCVESAPCGAVADALLKRNRVDAVPASREADVKAVLTKVVAGEADAGLVYATDAREAGDQVQVRPVPHSREVPNSYAIAVTSQARDADLAQAWVDLVTGERGRSRLAAAGFGTPDGS